ncbi:MAG: ABC transporter ATP-binding protein [Pseudomonadota bacterium]|nr:ABC transporter ATP-binding protein [Pseudomonadota bacterium]
MVILASEPMSATTPTVMNCSRISKRYGSNQAVAAVSLDLLQGQCIALLGRNGAGKTTICDMLVGIVSPDVGSIELFGNPYHAKIANKRAVLQDVGILSQDTKLYQKLTIKETLDLFASLYNHNIPVPTLIEQLNLEDKATKRLEHLSGGERQRAYLGAALVGDPKLIFLDEPTTGLDPISRKNVWDIISVLKKDGRSIFLTTHYMEEAEYLADDIAVIEKGSVIARGSPQQLITEHTPESIISLQLQHTTTVADLKPLLASSPDVATTAAAITLMAHEDNKIELKTSDTIPAIKKIFAFFDNQNKIISMEFRSGTLEDVFFKLTGKKLP